MPTDRPETILSTARTKKKLPSANPVTFIVYILLGCSYETGRITSKGGVEKVVQREKKRTKPSRQLIVRS